MSEQTEVVGGQELDVFLFGLLARELTTPCMIDVGAHWGMTLEPFLEADWQVHAFEPVEANRQILARRCGGKGNLVIRGEAVSSHSGQRPFHLAVHPDGRLHDYHHSLEHTASTDDHRKGPVVEIDTVSLDDLVRRGELPKQVGLLKIDTEGHDLAVLQGASQLHCETICAEFWRDGVVLGPSPSPAESIIDLLRPRGYRSYLVIARRLETTTVFPSTLAELQADHYGNLVFFHESSEQLYEHILARRDWRFAVNACRDCGDLRDQLREKEAVIRELHQATVDYRAELMRREMMIQDLRRRPVRTVLARMARWLSRRGTRLGGRVHRTSAQE